MTEIAATDSFGRRTVFRGVELISDTTDNGEKRQWTDIDVWRTEGGAYVVKRAVHYRTVHARKNCPRLEGYVIREADDEDTVNCDVCNRAGRDGWAQGSRVTVDVYREPEDLIEGLKLKGEWTYFSKLVLAELSDKDKRIDALWNTVRVD